MCSCLNRPEGTSYDRIAPVQDRGPERAALGTILYATFEPAVLRSLDGSNDTSLAFLILLAIALLVAGFHLSISWRLRRMESPTDALHQPRRHPDPATEVDGQPIPDDAIAPALIDRGRTLRRLPPPQGEAVYSGLCRRRRNTEQLPTGVEPDDLDVVPAALLPYVSRQLEVPLAHRLTFSIHPARAVRGVAQRLRHTKRRLVIPKRRRIESSSAESGEREVDDSCPHLLPDASALVLPSEP